MVAVAFGLSYSGGRWGHFCRGRHALSKWLAGADLDCRVLFVVPFERLVLLVLFGGLAVTMEGCLTSVSLHFKLGLRGGFFCLVLTVVLKPPRDCKRWHNEFF